MRPVPSSQPHACIEYERERYCAALPTPDVKWPPDVQVMVDEVHAHLFAPGITVEALRQRSGLCNHNVTSRFRHFVGRSIKDYIVHHRLELAKRLLRYDALNVAQVAFAVGYESSNGFSMTFKRRESQTPTAFRKKVVKKDGM